MRGSARGLHRRLAVVASTVLVAAVSIAVALLVTPMQQVSLAGQTVGVGAAAPSLSVSGPGELDLFGQRLPTTLRFDGPVRPRLALTQITLGSQLAAAFAPHRPSPERAIGAALAAGWTRYFAWEIVITAGCALLLAGAVAGWLRLPVRQTLVLLAVTAVCTEAINVGGIMATAYTAPARLRHVSSLVALAGVAPLPAVPAAPGPPVPGVQVVVMGDSTAAGIGNPGFVHPTRLERACQRSADSYAVDLGVISNWRVLNLACSSATIVAGILGPQPLGTITAPPQLAVAKKAVNASAVVISVGADDLGWSALLQLCTVTPECDGRAATAYFQQRLHAFTVSYYQLLRRLAALPTRPVVVINLYYDPFDTQMHCLDNLGLTPAKEKSLLGLLQALNGVLASGARASGFTAVTPNFSGHALCDAEPYVQGVHSRAPFHPTIAGELAIALADGQAIDRAIAARAPAVPPSPSSSRSLSPSPSPRGRSAPRSRGSTS